MADKKITPIRQPMSEIKSAPADQVTKTDDSVQLKQTSDDDELERVSALIQQAMATVDLVCISSETLEIPGSYGETLQNSLWGVIDQLDLAQQILNGEKVPSSHWR